ncbi:uncharacterized protein [Clytia hemisphaerica]|uniref:Metalloendopeptidase n=1 Tax=Clytia hemisphaerica TaxID=252671 RepID=A0A7M5X2D4_9CNID
MKASKCLRVMLCVAALATLCHGGSLKKRLFGALKKLGMDAVSSYDPTPDVKENVLNPTKGRRVYSEAKHRFELQRERLAGFKDPTVVEGDLKNLSPAIKNLINGKATKREIMSAVKWPVERDGDDKPVVNIPYVNDGLSDNGKQALDAAIEDLKQFTCIRLAPRSSQADYIRFFKGEGCFSTIGRTGGKQDLSIGGGCGYKGTVLHEIMHALGFFHEHTRPDRDDHIIVKFENIIDNMEFNFKKYPHNLVTDFNAPYDLHSVTHYNQYAFSTGVGVQSIQPKDPSFDVNSMGQRFGMSVTDAAQIRAAYCEQPFTTTTTSTTTTIPPPPVLPTTSTTTLDPDLLNPPTTTTTTLVPPLLPTTTTTLVPPLDTTTTTTTLVPPLLPTTTTTTTLIPPIPVLPTTSTTTLDPDLLKTTTTTTLPGQTTISTTTSTTPVPGEENGCPMPPCEQCQNPACGQQQGGQCPYQAPCWPSDFMWSNTGFPQTCGCNGDQQQSQDQQQQQGQDTNNNDGPTEPAKDENDKRCNMCKCLSIKSKSTPKSWEHNHFCYKPGSHDPNFKILRNGDIAGKRCLLIDDSKESDNLHLCFNKSAPYDLSWSDVDQTDVDGKSRCLKMENPHDWAWGKQKFLCQSPPN